MAQKKAFTLIELLIVVAIIAILAAIALPNFLEAQTRSRVSRCKSDMVTCAKMIEAYRVDNNIYPYLGSDAGVMEYLRWTDASNREHGIGWLLTTPVSYMSAIPFDVFNTNMNKTRRPHNMSVNIVHASFFMRASKKNAIAWQGGWCAWPPPGNNGTEWKYFGFMLSSCGPDLIPWPQDQPSNDYWTGTDYDPTNGTVSFGDIYYIDTQGLRGGGMR